MSTTLDSDTQSLVRMNGLFSVLTPADLLCYGLRPEMRHGKKFDEEVLIEVHRNPNGTVKHIVQPIPMFGPARVLFNHRSVDHTEYTFGLPKACTWQIVRSRLTGEVEFLVDMEPVAAEDLTEEQQLFCRVWRPLHRLGSYRDNLNRACSIANVLPRSWLIDEMTDRIHKLLTEDEPSKLDPLNFTIAIADAPRFDSNGHPTGLLHERRPTMTRELLILRLPELTCKILGFRLAEEQPDTHRFLEDFVNLAARRLLPIVLDRVSMRFHRQIKDADHLDQQDDLLRQVTIAPLTPFGRD